MTDAERDALYRCDWGHWHVVPSLARLCQGHVRVDFTLSRVA